MKFKEVIYSRTKNLGNYNSERLELRAEVDAGESVDAVFFAVKEKVLQLQKEQKQTVPSIPDSANVISETLFTDLIWKPETGAKLGEYEISLIQSNDPDKWNKAYNFLLNEQSTISKRFHEESYKFSYWLYPKKYDYKIFRQKLKEGSQ